MIIIRVKGWDNKTGEPVEKDHVIHELLDCICETYDEYISYMLHEAIRVCRSNDWHFAGFEIIVE